MQLCDRPEIENLRQALTNRLQGYSSSLIYMKRCTKLQLVPSWLCGVQIGFTFFTLLLVNTCLLPHPKVENNSFFGLRNAAFLVLLSMSKVALRKNFSTINYSSLWNELPKHKRMIFTASVILKKKIRKATAVQIC